MSRSEVERLAAGKYLSLTTFKKDGSAVATPVWVARDGDRLVVITDASSGKAKRLRNDDHVRLAPCDMRGKVTGPGHEGRATLVGEADTAHITGLIKRKYGFAYSVMGLMEKFRRRGESASVGIRIEVGQS